MDSGFALGGVWVDSEDYVGGCVGGVVGELFCGGGEWGYVGDELVCGCGMWRRFPELPFLELPFFIFVSGWQRG